MSEKPQTKIALYGGTNLSRENAGFVGQLVRAFLSSDPHVVLVGGGIYARTKMSVDRATYEAAESYVREHRQNIDDRLQTWLTRRKRPGIRRKRWGKKKYLGGSPLSRRFQLVSKVDAVVTIEGEGETATVLELAIALGRIALPIGFTGSDSKRFWTTDRGYFVRTLSLAPSLVDRLSRRPTPRSSLRLAEDVTAAVLAKANRQCLVLFDFTDKAHGAFYEKVVLPTVQKAGFNVRMIDKARIGADILELFLESLKNCHAIIADLSGLNKNVIYEIGRAHHDQRVQPLILSRDPPGKPPFYLSRYLFKWIKQPDWSDAVEFIRAYLKDDNSARSVAGPIEPGQR